MKKSTGCTMILLAALMLCLTSCGEKPFDMNTLIGMKKEEAFKALSVSEDEAVDLDNAYRLPGSYSWHGMDGSLVLFIDYKTDEVCQYAYQFFDLTEESYGELQALYRGLVEAYGEPYTASYTPEQDRLAELEQKETMEELSVYGGLADRWLIDDAYDLDVLLDMSEYNEKGTMWLTATIRNKPTVFEEFPPDLSS